MYLGSLEVKYFNFVSKEVIEIRWKWNSDFVKKNQKMKYNNIIKTAMVFLPLRICIFTEKMPCMVNRPSEQDQVNVIPESWIETFETDGAKNCGCKF